MKRNSHANVTYALRMIVVVLLLSASRIRADIFLSFSPDVANREAGSVRMHLFVGDTAMLQLYLVETETSDLETFGLVTNGLRLIYPTTPDVGFVSSVATAPGFTRLAPNLISSGVVQHTSATTAAGDVVRPSSQGLGHSASIHLVSVEVSGTAEGTLDINVERPRTVDNRTEVNAFFIDDGMEPRVFRDANIFASIPTATVVISAIPEPGVVPYLSLLTITSAFVFAVRRRGHLVGVFVKVWHS